jgi:NTE family protein
VRARPLASDDHDAVRAIFRSTLLLGRELSFAVPDLSRYESLCLDWYLGPGHEDAAVVEADDGRVVGYALVCTDSDAHSRWMRRRAVRFTLSVARGFALGRYRGDAARFYRSRLRDGMAMWRSAPAAPMPAHVHLNLEQGWRGGAARRLLTDHIDDRVRRAGLPGWYGEINALAGHRSRAIERMGGQVAHRAPNHTLTALVGKPVERLTLVRSFTSPLPPPPRPRRRRTRAPETAFVFPSGGSSGAAQVGILRSLLEAGIRPDVMVGSSVGALNAAFVAMDPTVAQVERLATIWRGLTREDVFGRNRYGTITRVVLRHDHIYTPAALRALIARFCALTELAETKVPVHVATTDLDNGVARWWEAGPALDILYASACLPGLFPPAMLGGHRHVDGGVLEPAPVQRAVDLDANDVYVLGEIVGPEEERPRRLTALDVLIRSFAISRYARLPEPSALARAGQRVITVPGADTTDVEITDFSQTDRIIDESRLRSRRFLLGETPEAEQAKQAGQAAAEEPAIRLPEIAHASNDSQKVAVPLAGGS